VRPAEKVKPRPDENARRLLALREELNKGLTLKDAVKAVNERFRRRAEES